VPNCLANGEPEIVPMSQIVRPSKFADSKMVGVNAHRMGLPTHNGFRLGLERRDCYTAEIA
jgi:hypothetical protein